MPTTGNRYIQGAVRSLELCLLYSKTQIWKAKTMRHNLAQQLGQVTRIAKYSKINPSDSWLTEIRAVFDYRNGPSPLSSSWMKPRDVNDSRCADSFSEMKLRTIDRSARVVAKHRVHLVAECCGRHASRRLKVTGIRVSVIGAWLVQRVRDVVLWEDSNKKEQGEDAVSLVDKFVSEVGAFLERKFTS